MELLDAFRDYAYPAEIGPGVYDIHSPGVPSVEEMAELLRLAETRVPVGNLWANPDCGLKTRKWPETQAALANMVAAARWYESPLDDSQGFSARRCWTGAFGRRAGGRGPARPRGGGRGAFGRLTSATQTV
jgi:hypothetical protein